MSEPRRPIDLVVNGRFLTRPPTGVDRVAHEMLRALSARVGEAGPLASIRVASPPAGAADAGLPAAVACDRFGRLRGTLWEQLELPRRVRRQWLYSPCNVGPLRHAPHIVTIHDAQVFLAPDSYSPAFRNWYRWLLPRLARRARIVTTVSEFAKRTLEQFGIVPPGKAVVIHNGADHILRIRPDPDALRRNGLTPGRYFLAIGSLSPHKNLKTVTAAATLRSDRSIPLVVAGGGNARVFVDAGLEPADDVRFLGRVTDAELRALLDGATALLLPSLFEGFGLPAVEAMHCGCPVVAADIPVLREVCGDAAVFADPRDPTVWAARMEQLARDPGARSRLREEGFRACATYTWDRAAARLLEQLTNVAIGDPYPVRGRSPSAISARSADARLVQSHPAERGVETIRRDHDPYPDRLTSAPVSCERTGPA